MDQKALTAPGIVLQTKPLVYMTALPGRWLLAHSTPSWRLDDPEKGFQRIVREARARQIATAVLAQRRVFPNAITLATDAGRFNAAGDCNLVFPAKAKFLVVDGQHRLWAQKFEQNFEATYSCIVHMDLSEEQMARLFLEINDTQRRVPSSLRWDLVRLVRPQGEELKVLTTELIYNLATEASSPLCQRIDLTGEVNEISLKQGSLAPEIQKVLSKDRKRLERGFEAYYDLFVRYFTAIRSIDPDGWGTSKGIYYRARVLRALLRLLTVFLAKKPTEPLDGPWASIESFRHHLSRIDSETLSSDAIRTAQGAVGVTEIFNQIRNQVFPDEAQ